ncbi:sce7726 family protein [Tepidibacillus decaturensis]|uniref:Sce7726 family protein n=1 Tax=Tepidibacillus decaturensis TaxID=1413211 RepID=A0A135L6D9_9BACI|nr:sce7726 family protein [Tepidibacillus decaturensis]KXG44571.1 hypothetical protein U473_11495 [Tepidibacillus decaturensis]
MNKLKDQDVRNVLLEELNSIYSEDENTIIINELGIDFGASRIDIAVVNGIMHGYEIKSESDTLNRLPKQMEYYNRVFERMTIVVDRKYYEETKNLVPKWWGITIVNKKNGSIQLQQKRKGRKRTPQDKELLLKLLWKDELEKFVDVLGLPKHFKRLKKLQLLDLFCSEAEINIIRPFVYEALKTRKLWRN